MNYMVKRSFHATLILVFCVLTFLNVGYAVKTASEVKKYEPQTLTQYNQRLRQQCTQRVSESAFEISDSSDKFITAHLKESLADPTLAMTRSASLIYNCPGYDLSNFCMGPECEADLTLTLRRQP